MASMIPLDSSKLDESLDKIQWVGQKHTPIYIKGNGKKEIYIYMCVNRSIYYYYNFIKSHSQYLCPLLPGEEKIYMYLDKY